MEHLRNMEITLIMGIAILLIHPLLHQAIKLHYSANCYLQRDYIYTLMLPNQEICYFTISFFFLLSLS